MGISSRANEHLDVHSNAVLLVDTIQKAPPHVEPVLPQERGALPGETIDCRA